MSVYARKRKAGTAWVYEFEIAGRRFHGPTSYPTKAAAQAAERLRRIAIAQGKDDARDRLTLNQAAGRYWEDVARHHRSAAAIERKIETLLRLLGRDTLVVDIKTATVNAAIQKRRAERVVNAAAARGGKKIDKVVSPATVNRDVIDQLRPILNHAGEIYELALPRIAWRRMRLKEADEIVREFTDAEIEAWASELKWTEQAFLGIALTYGPRFGEMFFPPDALKAPFTDAAELQLGRYKGRSGRISKTRKDGSLHTLPLLPEHGALLGALGQKAQAAGLDVVWFDEADNGRLTEITYWGMRQRLLDAARRAGISGGRILHGMRHHAGTQILRRTRNLVLAQRTLGHKQVATTQRYAHASSSDLRAGLAEVSRYIPDANPRALPKPEKKQSDEDA